MKTVHNTDQVPYTTQTKYTILYYIILIDIILYHIILHQMISYYIISYYGLSYHIISHHIILYHTILHQSNRHPPLFTSLNNAYAVHTIPQMMYMKVPWRSTWPSQRGSVDEKLRRRTSLRKFGAAKYTSDSTMQTQSVR